MDELNRLIKTYVNEQERYQEAAKIVQRHKKMQDRIKELYQQMGLKRHDLDQDGYLVTLVFQPVITHRVDTTNLPAEIKSRFQKQVILLKEKLTIMRRP